MRPAGYQPKRRYRRVPLDQRILRWVNVDDNGCWIWTGTRDQAGYGQVRIDYVLVSAHRAAYEIFIGQIPEGLTLDHLCRNPPCCNPAHLEPVTNRENILRGTAPCAENARKTHCVRGHALTPDNTYPGRPGRACITCARARAMARYHSGTGAAAYQSTDYCRNGHHRATVGVYRNGKGAPRCAACARAATRRWEARRTTASVA